MKSIQVIGLVALAVVLAAGCATKQSDMPPTHGGGMYSALDATAQVYSDPLAQAAIEDFPLRWVGFALHPIGVVMDYAINRPIYAFTSSFPTLFGYTGEDVMISSQRQRK